MSEVGAVEYKISQHCKQRYAERIMDKGDKNDINRFIAENEEKIQTDICKMIHYGELIFSGRQSQKDGKGNDLNVFLKDCWVVLADSKSDVVVTLYKIDLGLGDDFNKLYVSKMVEKINDAESNLCNMQTEAQKESTMYREMINEAEIQINEYKTMIKNLENLCYGYKSIIENNTVKTYQASRAVADVVNQLIGKKEF